MKNILLILIFQLNNCNTPKKITQIPKEITQIPKEITQILKDTIYYSNNQLAYKKEKNIVKFYTYKGKLEREINLNTRIEKRYNLTDELMDINVGINYMFEMRNGYYSYRDLLITPSGTIVHNGKEFGSISTAHEVIDTIPKNNLGYPASFKFNETGQITQIGNEKREFDDLGRITKREIYSGLDDEPYKLVEYIYDKDNLKMSKHTGVNKPYNFTKEYVFNTKGQIYEVKQYIDGGLKSITLYNFSDNLLKTKKIFIQDNNYINLELIEYKYDDNKRCINEKYYLNSDKNITTLKQIENKLDITINKEDAYEEISTVYTFEDESLIGVKKIDLKFTPTPKVVKEHVYIYNKYKQLIKVLDVLDVVDNTGKTLIEFSYMN